MKFLTVEAAANYKLADLKAEMHCLHAAKLNSTFVSRQWMPHANWGEIFSAIQDSTSHFRKHEHRFSVFVFDDTADSVWWQLKQKKTAKFTTFEVDNSVLPTLAHTLMQATVGDQLAQLCFKETFFGTADLGRYRDKANKAGLEQRFDAIRLQTHQASCDSYDWMTESTNIFDQLTSTTW